PCGGRGFECAGTRHLAGRSLAEDSDAQRFALIGSEADLSRVNRDEIGRPLSGWDVGEIHSSSAAKQVKRVVAGGLPGDCMYERPGAIADKGRRKGLTQASKVRNTPHAGEHRGGVLIPLPVREQSVTLAIADLAD